MSNNKELVVYGLITTFSAGIGFGGGYLIAKKRHERIADEEIASIKETYGRLAANANKPTPEELAAKARDEIAEREAAELIAQYDGSNEPATDEPQHNEYADEAAEAVQEAFEKNNEELEDKVEEAIHDIFESHSDNAAKQPSDEKPYLVSVDVWNDNEWDHHAKISLVYYAGDNTLADQQEQIVDDEDRMVGIENLTRFGVDSGDPNIVYVRNEKLGIDFEIVRNEGRYLPNNEE